MSLKSRLLNKVQKSSPIQPQIKEQDQEQPIPIETQPTRVDLLAFFDNNPDLSALVVYGPNSIFVEKNGIVYESELSLKNNESLMATIQDIANQYDKIINFQNPSFNITLANGVKINAIILPMAKEGAYLSLRRVFKCSGSQNNVFEDKVASNEVTLFLKACLDMNLNIFVTGSPLADKTRVLNYLANKISDKESIITIESLPQLKLKSDQVLSLIKQKGNFLKVLKKAINLKHDRMIISDVNVCDMVPLFSYINTGYSGFIASFPTKSYEDLFTSMQNLIMLDYPNLPAQNIESLIKSVFDVVVYVDKTLDGTVRITHVGELVKSRNEMKLQDIFVWKESKSKTNKFNGTHCSTGIKSKHLANTSLQFPGLLDEYFTKDYKHNYVGLGTIKAVDKLKKTAKALNGQNKLNKYSALKQKIKSND